MILDSAIPYIGPVVVATNIIIMFLCLQPRRGTLFTLCMLAINAVVVHLLTLLVGMWDMSLVRFCGILFLPGFLLLFRGHPFQIAFAFFMQYQVTALPTHIADALVGATIGYESPYAMTMFLVISLVLLAIYLALVLRYGRRLFDRMFLDGRRGVWAVYSLGAMFSFILFLSVDWTALGAALYIALMLFILWSFGVLCFTIINIHEKAAQEHNAETLALQMGAMREQTESEKKHRDTMEILRHDMRHEMGVIMELYRAGKAAEAETIYADWQNALKEAVPALLCAEPILNAVLTRFAHRAKDMNIFLYVNTNVPGTLPIDTIKLSVMIANALENALAATDKVQEDDKRVIRVKLLQSGNQIGLEVINPCAAPVEFDEKGLPVTREQGHGIGVRSIAAFAQDNNCMLDFSNIDGKFTMRLVMKLDAQGAGGE
ncbi:MAG TPA: hypothetical protein DEB31_08060 [Clostridiales bacterium]|nr:hypothetical protein [Clostridiales bacterium]